MGVANRKQDLRAELYPPLVRSKQIRMRICVILGHALLMIYIGALIAIFWESWRIDCIRKLNVWLSVYFFIELLHCLERLASLFSWGFANDPSLADVRLYIFLRLWLYLLEASWIIYGSSFIYEVEMDECEAESVEAGVYAADFVKPLRISTEVLIIYGYLLLLWLVGGFCLALFMYRAYVSYVKADKELAKAMKSNLSQASTASDPRLLELRRKKIRAYETKNILFLSKLHSVKTGDVFKPKTRRSTTTTLAVSSLPL